MKVKVAPSPKVPESKAPPTAVQVWAMESSLRTVTVSPTEPLLSPENAKLAMVICRAAGGAVVVVLATVVVGAVVVIGAVVVGALVVVGAVVAGAAVVVVLAVEVVEGADVAGGAVEVAALVVTGGSVVAGPDAVVVVSSSGVTSAGSPPDVLQAAAKTTGRIQARR